MNKYVVLFILILGLRTGICQIPILNEKNLIRNPDTLHQVSNQVIIDDMIFLTNKINGKAEAFSPVRAWTDGKVYYKFDESVSLVMRSRFTSAFYKWEKNTPLKFIIRDSELHYIFIVQSDRNSSYVGMVGGRQELNIVSNNTGVVLHELGHAIGLCHEHQRSDRDKYVEIFLDNVILGKERNFTFKPLTIFYFSYDFLSIMHYPKWAFSSNGENTIEPQSEYIEFIDDMGQRDSLTTKDMQTVNNLYNQIPALLSPENGIRDISQNYASLIWSNVPEAISFQLQVSRDPLFQSLTSDKIVDSEFPLSQYIFTHQESISNLSPSATYFWRIRAISPDGLREWSSIFNFTVKSNSSENFWIYPAYPNPFNSSTTIKFELKKSEFIKISIYNILGKKISDLVSGFFLNGTYTVPWDAKYFASGVYFCHLQTKSTSRSIKLILYK